MAHVDAVTPVTRQSQKRSADGSLARRVTADGVSASGPATTDAIGTIAVTDLTEPAAVERLSAECEPLIREALEPNVFYEPWMLSAALRSLSAPDVHVVVVRHRLVGPIGIFPLQLERRFRGLPLRVLKSWRHLYCFLCTPLVSATYGRAAVAAFLDWAESDAAPANLIEWEQVAADGPFHALLTDELATRRHWQVKAHHYQRALFNAGGDAATAISGKHLKEIRRLKRRLSESGQCTYRVLESGEPIEGWIERFLDIEARGWKGRQRTALASQQGSRRFFEQATHTAAARRRLQMLAIELDGVPIAMKCNFLAGEGAFAFKIAYDERFARYSPGVLLELFNMSNLAERSPDTRWMDSCASPEHFMIDRVWTGRRTLVDSLMSSRGLAAVMVRHWHRYRAVRNFLRRLLSAGKHRD